MWCSRREFTTVVASGLGENLNRDLFLRRHVYIHSDHPETVAGNIIEHDSRYLLSTEKVRRDFLQDRDVLDSSNPDPVWECRLTWIALSNTFQHLHDVIMSNWGASPFQSNSHCCEYITSNMCFPAPPFPP